MTNSFRRKHFLAASMFAVNVFAADLFGANFVTTKVFLYNHGPDKP